LPQVLSNPFKFKKLSNAYILVYIRDSSKDEIFCNVDEKVIFEHIRATLEREKEKKMKEKAKADSHTIIKVAWKAHCVKHIQEDVFDLVDHHNVQTFCVPKDMPFSTFKKLLAFQKYLLWRNVIGCGANIGQIDNFRKKCSK
ncbi:ubiquitin carboxyl-terminal hydrolase 12-like, partial [Trifolium medium]|nr:ubiquitin carboxyl-terminal hydrolase 12-like [Trifolium medium]